MPLQVEALSFSPCRCPLQVPASPHNTALGDSSPLRGGLCSGAKQRKKGSWCPQVQVQAQRSLCGQHPMLRVCVCRCVFVCKCVGFHDGTVVKNLPANVGDTRDVGLIPGSRRSPAGGKANSLQYSHLENSMDRGGQRAIVHGVTKNQTQLSD